MKTIFYSKEATGPGAVSRWSPSYMVSVPLEKQHVGVRDSGCGFKHIWVPILNILPNFEQFKAQRLFFVLQMGIKYTFLSYSEVYMQ